MRGEFYDLTLFEIDILSTFADHSSLRAVCRARKLEAPHASKILYRLERKLGRKLLVRSPKGYHLTPDGIRAVASARKMTQTFPELIDRESMTAETAEPFMSIAAPRFVGAYIMAPVLHRMQLVGLKSRFRILDSSPDEIIAAAVKGICEIIISIGEPKLPRTWTTSRVGTMAWGLFSSVSNPLAKKTTELKVREKPFLVPTYWTGTAFEVGDDYCPLPWKKRKRGDETSSLMTAIEVLKLSPNQVLFGPKRVVLAQTHGLGVKEIRVNGWPEVEKSLYLSVMSAAVNQKIHRLLLEKLGEELSESPTTHGF